MSKKERISRVGLADPRGPKEKAAAMINRVASGNRNAPVRKWDDSPAVLAKNVAESKARNARKAKK